MCLKAFQEFPSTAVFNPRQVLLDDSLYEQVDV